MTWIPINNTKDAHKWTRHQASALLEIHAFSSTQLIYKSAIDEEQIKAGTQNVKLFST